MAVLQVAFNFQPDTVVGFPHDVTAYVRSITINRGASPEPSYPTHYQAGTATLALSNADGRFDPFNVSSGTYVADGESLIVPMRPMVQISVDDGNGSDLQPIFTGFVERWLPTYPAMAHDSVTVCECVDATARIAAIDRGDGVAATGVDDPTGQRIDRILDAISWPAADRDIPPGPGNQAILATTTLAGNPWAEIVLTADSEPGEVFIAKNGAVTFLDRDTLFGNGVFGSFSSFTFTDATPPTNGYRDIVMAADASLVLNDITITAADETPPGAQASDITSIDRYGLRSYAREDLLFIEAARPGASQNYADLVLSVLKDARPRIDSLTFMPASDTAHLWAAVKDLELGHRVTVRFQPPGAPVIERDCIIRGISHSGGLGLTTSWVTTFRLQDGERLAVGLYGDTGDRGRYDSARYSS